MKQSAFLGLFLLIGVQILHAASETGESWVRVDEALHDPVASVAWDGPVPVGVGPRGMVCSSTDGKSWTPRASGTGADLGEVVWSGSEYVAVGGGGTAIRSLDGINWQRIQTPVTSDLTGITWTGTQFLAVGTDLTLLSSNQGLMWSVLSPGTSSDIAQGIYFVDGASYLTHTSGISRSTNLIDWTVVHNDFRNPPVIHQVRKLNGKLFAVGQRARILSSDDGITWVAGTRDEPYDSWDLHDISWNGNSYVALGASAGIYRSVNGQDWTFRGSQAGEQTAVTWRNGEFLAIDRQRSAHTSPDGIHWTSPRKGVYTSFESIVWTGTRYIGVGDYGRILTSPDYESWTTRDAGTFSHLHSVVWTGSFALASGADGVVLKSIDGIDWTRVAQATFQNHVDLVWTGTEIFAIGGDGTYRSTSGTSWMQVSSDPVSFSQVKWDGAKFIGVGGSGEIRTSPTGAVWTEQDSGTTEVLLAAGSSGSEILVGGQNGTLLASSDGTTWTPRSFPPTTINAIDHRFGRWIVASRNGIHTSADGITWNVVADIDPAPGITIWQRRLVWNGTELICTELDASTSDGTLWNQRDIHRDPPHYLAVAKGGSGYVAVGAAGAISHSLDGYSWNSEASPTTSNLNAVVEGQGTWVAVGDGGVITTSSDGDTWSAASSGTTGNLHSVAWNGSRFAAVGDGGVILVSPDGISWSTKDIGSPVQITEVVAAGTAFHAFGPSGIRIRSSDGDHWESDLPGDMADIVWTNSQYVATGTSGWAYVSSPDGLQWTRHTTGTTAYLTGLCWTGTRLVAVGTNGTIVTSPDGETWTPRESGTTGWLQSVLWNGTQLVAVGHDGIVLTSPHGINWTNRASGTTADIEKVAWANGRYVTVGRSSEASVMSEDGVTWQPWPRRARPPAFAWTVEWIGDRFLAAASDLSSTTGSIWLSQTSDLPGAIYDLEWTGTRLLAVGGTGVTTLEEYAPSRWRSHEEHVAPFLDNITRNGNELVAVGHNETVVLSRDGIMWETVQGGQIGTFSDVTWSGSRFLSVGGDLASVSTDGETWKTTRPLAQVTYRDEPAYRGVTWTGSRFVVIGDRGVFLASNDGEHWANLGDLSARPDGLTAITGDDTLLLVVGSDGYIAVSDGTRDPVNDYALWIGNQGIGPDEDDPWQDPNGDGIDNMQAFIHGIPASGPPLSSSRAALPSLSIDPETGTRNFSFELRDSYRSHVRYQVMVSHDLSPHSWFIVQDRTVAWASGSAWATATESPLPGGGLHINISDIPNSTTQPAQYVRLRVIFQQP